MVEITQHSGMDLPPIDNLLIESELEEYEFLLRLKSEWLASENCFDGRGELLILGSVDDQVVGVGGLNVDPYAGDPCVGRIRHVFVTQLFRRCKVGTKLVRRLIQSAEGTFREIRLRTNTPHGDQLYLSLGFRRITDSTTATHVMQLGT